MFRPMVQESTFVLAKFHQKMKLKFKKYIYETFNHQEMKKKIKKIL
jgi:hypothetical protein